MDTLLQAQNHIPLLSGSINGFLIENDYLLKIVFAKHSFQTE